MPDLNAWRSRFRRDRFDSGGTPMFRVRHASWYQRTSARTLFFTVLFGLLGLLTIGPIAALLLAYAFIP